MTPPSILAAPLALGEPNEILKALDSIRFRRGPVGRSVGRGQRRRRRSLQSFSRGQMLRKKQAAEGAGGREDDRTTNPGSGFAASKPLSLSLSLPLLE